uniref:transglycosylase domain-containing protein n=1 Tax=uncultured Roseobacter sp. TaxID=114847 RepID=UPI002605D9BA
KSIQCMLAVIILASAAKAQDPTPALPSPDAIRAHYQNASASWPTIPRTAQVAFVVANDRRYFEQTFEKSRMVEWVGKHYPVALQRIWLARRALAFSIVDALSREEVLNWYVNQIYLGQGCYGLPAAAYAYFGKPVGDLRLEELAYLAGLPAAPSSFHPVKFHDRAVERRNFVLKELLEAGFVTEREAETAMRTDLVVVQALNPCEPEE